MRRCAHALGFLPLLLALALPSLALTNTFETLIIEPGESFTASGTIYKSVSIHVKAGGTLNLPQDAYTQPDAWRLQLIAPWVRIDGQIMAKRVSYNTQGSGWTGGGSLGPGGSGYGGRGGDGEAYPNSGGPAYDSPNHLLESTGSKGVNHPYGGGGSIRIDAFVLTVTSNATLSASAYQPAATGGGGSGGGILLNGVHSFLSSYSLLAVGGDGQLRSAPTVIPTYTSTSSPTYSPTVTSSVTPVSGGGGGAGGRLRLFAYPDFTYQPEFHDVRGGYGGGGGAQNGGPGTYEVIPAPTPMAPQLLSPLEGQIVGLAPTFNFTTSDPQLSQFLAYHIQIAAESAFTTIVHESYQPQLDPGWFGIKYYASNVTASYSMPTGILSTDTPYYWRVRVNNGMGWNSLYSPIRSFRTIPIVNHPPVRPVLLAPPSGQLNASKLPVFQMLGADPDGNTLTFTILLSQAPDLSNPKIFQSAYPGWDASEYPPDGKYSGVTATCQVLNTSSYPDALQPGATYFWQTVAYDTYQETSRSAVDTFTVVALPSTPALSAPADQAVITTQNPALTMSSTSPTNGTLRYRLELSSDDFQTIITFLSESSPGWSQTSYASGAVASLRIPAAYTLVPGKTYAWRAAAYDTANDNWSAVAAARTFQVVTPPLLPQLLSPPDGTSAPDNGVTFVFDAVSESGNTLTYRCELSADRFSTVLWAFDQRGSTAGWDAAAYASGAPASFTLPASTAPERGRPYWWRVQAWDGISWGPVSEAWSFTVANALEVRRARLYPNPAVSTAALRLDLELSVDADVTLRVCNETGKPIKEYAFTARGGSGGNVFTLDIGAYASGAYFCIIETRSLYGTKRTVRRFAVVN